MATVQEIMGAVERFYKLKTGQLVSDDRTRAVSNPRKMAMYIARKDFRMTYQHIAEEMQRDHSTVIMNIRRFIKMLDEEHPNFDILLRKDHDVILANLRRIDIDRKIDEANAEKEKFNQQEGEQ